jgi:hypothetical protein
MLKCFATIDCLKQYVEYAENQSNMSVLQSNIDSETEYAII